METEDLTAGGATPLVLTVLSEGDGDGYAIMRRVRELAGGELAWPDGMLYPLLHRLSRLGYVTADWRPTSSGHRRRYYTITPTGRGAREGARLEGTRTRGRPAGMSDGLLPSTPSRPCPARRWPHPAGRAVPVRPVLRHLQGVPA